MKDRVVVGAVATALLLSACTGADSGARPSTGEIAGSGMSAGTASGGDHLTELSLPAGVCAHDAPAVQLAEGTAMNNADSVADEYSGDGSFVVALSSPASSARGDLDGDGSDELAVVVACGGYGGGNNSWTHIAVLRTGGPRPALLADLQPDSHGTGVGAAEVSIGPGVLHSIDHTYAEGDARCCPSSRDVTEWRWQNDRLVQTKPPPGPDNGGENDVDVPAPEEAVAAARTWYAAMMSSNTQQAARVQTPDFDSLVSGSALDRELTCHQWKTDNVSCIGFYGGGGGEYATAVEISLRAEAGRWLVWHATEESAG